MASNQQTPQLYVVAGSTAGAQAPGVYVAATSSSGGGGGGGTAPADVTKPVMTGAISPSAVTSTSYALSWPAATDDSGVVAGYEYSIDGGASYTSVGTSLTVAVSGRTPGATDSVRVRAVDAAGNYATPLQVAVTLLASAGIGSVSSQVLRDGLGALLVESGIRVSVLDAATLSTVVTKTALTSNASGVVTLSDPALVAGTTYVCVLRRGNGDVGLWKAVAA